MVVYANLLGRWTELGDNDYIEDETAEIYVNFKLSKEKLVTTNQFLEVSHHNLIYHVHVSQIQWISDRY